jgi:beta-lactamase regulating signal transducer with metallopeptidase domain
MTEVFLKFVNNGISAGWLVLIIIFLRMIPRIPKRMRPVFWGLVGVRLMLLVPVKSVFSLIPSVQTIAPEIMYARKPKIYTGIAILNTIVNPIVSESFSPNPGDSANSLQVLIPILSIVWIFGVVFMLGFALVNCLRLRRRIRMAVLLDKNIYQSEEVFSPFVFGFLHPRIYLPFAVDEKIMRNVILHEQAHITRYDHLRKIFGYLLLSLYWFNPLCWAAYMLFCKDIELACDECVICNFGKEERADYSETLLSFCVPKIKRNICPLAFGEIAVKERVKNVLRYKAPVSWIVMTAFAVCIVIALCFLTNPKHINFREAGLKEVYFLEGSDLLGGSLSFSDNYSYTLVFSGLSSYIGYGDYEIEGKKLKLSNFFDDNQYIFDIVNGTLVFDGEVSTDTRWWKGGEVLK